MKGLHKKPAAGQLMICLDGRTMEVGSGSGYFVTLTTAQTISGAKTLSAITTVSNATGSTAASNGALVVFGGAGFGENVSVAGNAQIGGTSAGMRLYAFGGTAVSSISANEVKISGGIIAASVFYGGNVARQSAAAIVSRLSGDGIEWGHTNVSSGYYFVCGSEAGSGAPFFAIGCRAGTTANTYRTEGIAGTVIVSDNAGGLSIGQATNASANNQALTTRLKVSSAGAFLSVDPTAGLGYGTGAGGTITQITSKATGVTLNKICGQITMQAAALGAGAKVSFVVTNSACSASTDEPRCWIVSGGTANAYRVDCTAVAAGSFTLTVENITGGSLSESPIIGFAIGKAVNA